MAQDGSDPDEGGDQNVTERSGGTHMSSDQDNAPAAVVTGVGAPEVSVEELREELEEELEELDQDIADLEADYNEATDPEVRAQIYDEALHAQADARMAAAELHALDNYDFSGSMSDFIDGNVGRSGFPSHGQMADMSGAERLRAVEAAGPRYMAQASGWDIIEVGPLDALPGGAFRRLGRLGRLRRGASAAARARARGRVQERIKGRRRRREQRRCRRSGGNPVMFDTGAVAQIDPIFQIPGLMPQVITSQYQSDNDVTGPLGWGRGSDLDATLERLDNGKLRYRDGAGFHVDFPQPTPVPGHWAEGDHVRLMEISAGHNRSFIIREEGELRRFEKGRDGRWHLSEVENRNGAKVLFERSETGMLTAIETPERLRLEMTNDEDHGLRMAVDLVARDGARVRVMSYSYDGAGNMTLADCPFGDRHEYAYDDHHRRIWFRKNGLYEAHYTFDAEGRVVHEKTNGPYDGTRFDYDPVRRITTYTPGGDAAAVERHYYHEDGAVFASATLDGRFTRFGFDGDGNLAEIQDGNGHKTTYGYDAMGNITQVIDAEGRTADFRYNDQGSMEFAVDPNGAAWESSYDELGNLVGMTDPMGFTTEITVNEMGQPTGLCRHDGFIRAMGYSDNHWLISSVDFDGTETRTTRDSFGRITAEDRAGAVITFEYAGAEGDDFWTPSVVRLADGTELRRDVITPRREIRQVDGEGHATTYTIDAFGKIEALVEPGGGRMTFRYDHREDLIAVENATGQVWQFERDPWGRLVAEVDFGGARTEYSHDEGDRITAARHADGTCVNWTYDKSGLTLTEEVLAPDTDPILTEFAYDDAGLMVEAKTADSLVTFERDEAGQVVAEVINGTRVEVTLDCCGRRLSRQIGDDQVAYRYDPTGRIAGVEIGAHAPLEMGYDGAGFEASRRSATGFALQSRHDTLGRLVDQRIHSPTRDNLGRRYAWNRNAEPVQIQDGLWGEARFGYDRNGQVTEATLGDGAGEAFGYDPALNIAASGFATPGGAGMGDLVSALSSWRAAPGGQVTDATAAGGATERLTYDDRNRVTERQVTRKGHRADVWRYAWDGKDRLAEVHTPDGTRWTYGYDAFARRLWKAEWRRSSEVDNSGMTSIIWVEGQRHDFLWDGDVIASETITAPGQGAQTVHWYQAPGTHVPIARRAGGHLSYVVTDALGTPKEILSEAGHLEWAADHSTWGRMRRSWSGEATQASKTPADEEDIWAFPYVPASDGSAALAVAAPVADRAYCPIRFQGQWEDVETGLHYNRHRYYLPEIGAYLTPDPIGYLGGFRPQGYVPTPTADLDPSGLNRALRNALGLVRGDRMQAHHVIPKEVWAANSGFFRDIGMAGQRDVAANGIALPNNQAMSRRQGIPYHCGSHPIYSAGAAAGVANIRADYEAGDITAAEARAEIGALQNGLRTAIRAMPGGTRLR